MIRVAFRPWYTLGKVKTVNNHGVGANIQGKVMVRGENKSPLTSLRNQNTKRTFFSGILSNKRTINVCRHLPYSHVDVFSVVRNVEDYPRFLPYCSDCKVADRQENSLNAALTFEHQLLQKGRETVLYKVDWDQHKSVFSVAHNTAFCKEISYSWRFNPSVNGCLADVKMNLEFHSPASAVLFDTFETVIKDRIIDAFVNRLRNGDYIKMADA